MRSVAHYMSELSRALEATPGKLLSDILETLWQTYLDDGTIITCGNGGSASTASHFACDLAKWTITPDRRRVRAVALTDNIPLMLAWSNDTAYERVFVEQLVNIYRPGDTIVAISGSGNSPNVLRAVEWANAQGATTIGLTGFSGGKLASLARLGIIAPSYFMPQVEDIHLAWCHALAVNLGELMTQSA